MTRRKTGMQRAHHDGLYVPRAPYDKNRIVDINHPLAQLIKLIPDMVSRILELEAELSGAQATSLGEVGCGR